MKKIALFGEYRENADHPFEPVSETFHDLLDGLADVSYIADYRKPIDLESFDLLILYNDTWEEPLKPDMLEKILCFAASGKTIMAIHCGIFYLQANHELLPLTAGRFYHHPPRCTLQYLVAEGEAPDAERVSFSLFEEPYLFHFSDAVPRQVFMVAEYQGAFLPQAWKTVYGKGQFVYLAPGHDKNSFCDPVYRAVLQKCVRETLES